MRLVGSKDEDQACTTQKAQRAKLST